MRRRVVITGLGPVSAIGVGPDAFFAALRAGSTGVGPITSFDPSGFNCHLAGEVRDLNVRSFVPKSYRKATKIMARDTELAVTAARIAAQDAGLRTRGSDDDEIGFDIIPARTGCQIGAGLIAAETAELSRALATAADDSGKFSLKLWGTGDDGGGAMNNLPPLWLLKYLPNMLACHVTIIHGTEGPSNTITCAEASALLSIGESARVIERGSAEVCFSGGAESKVNLMGMLRLTFAGRTADTGDATSGPEVLRPFDPESRGGLIGEGAGIMILEELDHAKARGAPQIYAEIVGFGAAHSPAPIFPGLFDSPRPEPMDPGLADAVEAALRDADIDPAAIDAIVPLGLGDPGLDAAEAAALKSVFGGRLASIPLITLTPAIGNCSAGHGGLAVAAAALSVHHGVLPARIHSGTPAEGIMAGASASTDARLEFVLVCSPALGGQNAAVVLRRAEESSS